MKENETKELVIAGCGIPVRISGRTYTLYATPELSDTVATLADEAIRLSMLTGNGKRSGVTADFLAGAIDGLLGEGTVNEIFGDSEPDLFGLCDILGFIAERFGDYRDMRYNQLADRAVMHL